MGKRKAELCSEEIVHQFKKRKVGNANGIIKLLIQLEVGSNRQLLDCIAALTDIAVQIIKDEDCSPSKHQKPDDLKDALDKFKDWIQDRLKDIIKKFISLLYHSKGVVAQKALSGLTSIIQQKARTDGVFPWVIYSKLVTALLSNKVDCRKLIQMLEEPLKADDLSFYTFKVLSRMLRNRGDNTSMVYKSNVVALVLLLRVAPKKQPVPAPPLWCSIRKGKAKKNKDKDPKKNIKILSKKALQKKEKEERVKNHRKSKYEEVLKQSLNKEEQESEDEEDKGLEEEDDSGKEEQPLDTADVDSDEEQRRADDQEFKAGQKVKPKRKRRDEGTETSEPEADVQQDSDPEDVNKVPVRKPILKPVSNKDRMLPPGVLELRSLHDLPQEEEEDEGCVEEEEEPLGPVFKYSYELACQYLSIIWERLMSFTLTEELYKRCLVFIPEQVMEFLRDPISLTDFFISSYNCGGGVSLLAMHGVFLLMTKHNLQYPQFYQKVHRLLEPSVFNARYKPRFFILLNVFLSSSHLPEYIAAAFVKSLSHLALFAPANCTLLVVKVLTNILNRFPSLRPLYDDETERPVSRDPFLVAASDLMTGGATESSLWEVATLNQSAPENLYKATLFIRNAGPPNEVDISPHLETFYEELDPSVAEYADNIKKAADNFVPVKELLNNASSNLNIWFDKEAS